MERGKMTGTVFFIDLSKAFDSVNHEIILDKLEKSNMWTSVINWFKSHLYERSQSVTVGGEHIKVPAAKHWCTTRIYFGSTVIYYLHQWPAIVSPSRV